jgi:hypothetical protein
MPSAQDMFLIAMVARIFELYPSSYVLPPRACAHRGYGVFRCHRCHGVMGADSPTTDLDVSGFVELACLPG